jgi:sortase A
MYGHVFHDLDQLEPGDQIVTYTETGRAVYRVVEVGVVDPTDVEVVAPTKDTRLTLTTCHPIGSARQRLVVVAELWE